MLHHTTKHEISHPVRRLCVARIVRLTGPAVGTVALILLAGPALAAGAEAVAHRDPVASVGLSLVVILLAAKLGGDLATRVGQPAVLGELVVGVVLGT